MDVGSVLSGIPWIAVLVAAAATFALGALWYGPLFGERWKELTGVTHEDRGPGDAPRIFASAFVLQVLAALVLAPFLGPDATLVVGLAAGGAVGLFWVATAIGVIYLFEGRSLLHWFIDAGYHVLGFVLMGGILGAWP